MRYMFDLDGTLCEEGGTFERSIAKPIQENIDIANELYESGNEIWIYTARGWLEDKMTKDWLSRHSVKYNNILFGKPVAHVWVDDRSINPLRENLRKIINESKSK